MKPRTTEYLLSIEVVKHNRPDDYPIKEFAGKPFTVAELSKDGRKTTIAFENTEKGNMDLEEFTTQLIEVFEEWDACT